MNCDNFVFCPLPSTFPLLGFSSEANDQYLVTAAGFGPMTPPPLGWKFGMASGTAFVQASSATQAEQNAYTQAVANAAATWSSPTGQPAFSPPDENIIDDDFLNGAPPIF